MGLGASRSHHSDSVISLYAFDTGGRPISICKSEIGFTKSLKPTQRMVLLSKPETAVVYVIAV